MRDLRAFLDAKLDVAEHALHLALLDQRAELRARRRRDGPAGSARAAPRRSPRPARRGSRHAPTRASRRGRFRPGCSRCPRRSPRRPRRDRRRPSRHAATCRRIRARRASCCSGRRRPCISLPTSVEPVKAIMSTSGCSASGLPAFSPKPGTTLSTPSGKPGLLGEAPEQQRAERRLLRRLQDDRIAGDQRRADLPGADDERIVPRHDRADDAERLLADHRDVMRADRRDLVIELVGEFGVILDAVGAEGHVDARANWRSPCRRRASPAARSRRRARGSARRSAAAPAFSSGGRRRATRRSRRPPRAAFTARSMSAAPQSATWAKTFPSIGETLAKVAPSRAGT